jgi:hypothetical protein
MFVLMSRPGSITDGAVKNEADHSSHNLVSNLIVPGVILLIQQMVRGGLPQIMMSNRMLMSLTTCMSNTHEVYSLL